MQPVCIPHHSYIAHQVAVPFSEGDIAWALHICHFWGGSHYEYLIGRFTPAFKGNLPDGFVGSQHHVRAGVGKSFGQANGPVEKTAPPKFGLEHLRPEVVNIINDPHPKQLERPGHQKEEVRRIAEVDHFEPMPPPGLPRQPHFPPQRGEVLPEKPNQASGFLANPMSIDLDAVDFFLRFGVASHLRANHHHLITRIPQRARFLPDPAVERDGQVFDEDEDGVLHEGSEAKNVVRKRQGFSLGCAVSFRYGAQAVSRNAGETTPSKSSKVVAPGFPSGSVSTESTAVQFNPTSMVTATSAR